MKKITIGIAGNPNSGKTTLFNSLTGSKQHVGNWPGVTVEKREGEFKYKGYNFTAIDLPGTYSLTAYSIEEVVARDFILDDKPDLVINILDATNLERSLYLTSQLLFLGAPIIVALNMYDELPKNNIKIDLEHLSTLLGVPVIPTVANRKKGLTELLDRIILITEKKEQNKIPIKFFKEIEEEISKLEPLLENQIYSPRFLALKLLEDDEHIKGHVKFSENLQKQTEESIKRIETIYNDEPATVVADHRHGFASGIVKESVIFGSVDSLTPSDKIDKFLTNRLLGIPIFLFFMWLTFQIVFKVGDPLVAWTEILFEYFGHGVSVLLPDGNIKSLIVDGIIGGVGSVIVFLPNIALLFLIISLLEDSGYMARAAFVMDKLMHKIGLHGKSFIPMLMGFGCSVPAIMATRSLEHKKDRLLTMLIIPLMSCSAKLPVYTLLIAAFFHKSIAPNVLFSIYIIGIILAIIVAKLLNLFIFKGISTPFVMELPPYRIPTAKSIVIHMWEKSWLYLKKAGTIILAASVIIWFLSNFPKPAEHSSQTKPPTTVIPTESPTSSRGRAEGSLSSVIKGSLDSPARAGSLGMTKRGDSLEQSYAGKIGKFIEPAIAPLGFDWKIGIALTSGFAAKEIVVSTLGTLYSLGEADEESKDLKTALKKDNSFSPLVAYVLMIFVLLYVPCLATIATIKKESGKWRWAGFMIFYTIAIAWIVSFIVYRIGLFLNLAS